MSNFRNVVLVLVLTATACSSADDEMQDIEVFGHHYDAERHCVIDPEPVVVLTFKSEIIGSLNFACFVHAERQLISGYPFAEEGLRSCEHEPWFADSPHYPPRPMEERLCPEDE